MHRVHVTPYRVAIPDADLRDLRDRLRRTRWPERETVADRSQGVPLAYLQELCRHWAEAYDWRATEARLNALPQFRTALDGLGIHFLHVRSPHPDALPLVMTHGWPGSIVEFLDVLGPLTRARGARRRRRRRVPRGLPVAAGLRVQRQAVVDGLGRRADRPRVERADGTARLRALRRAGRRLGHERLREPRAAGPRSRRRASTSCRRWRHPTQRRSTTSPRPSGRRSTRCDHAEEWDSGYSAEHATRPQTVGYGLVDSPAGLCAWIVEKFWAWTDHDGDLEHVIPRDRLLDNLMLYWLPGTGASSARLYWESIRQVSEIITRSAGDTIDVPAGCSIFPKELQRPSRRWAERRFTDIRHWNELARGGHFAALEQPELFVGEVRAVFRHVR